MCDWDVLELFNFSFNKLWTVMFVENKRKRLRTIDEKYQGVQNHFGGSISSRVN